MDNDNDDERDELDDSEEEVAREPELQKKIDEIKVNWDFDHTASKGYDHRVLQQNTPVICEEFKDPATEQSKVLMAILMPGGADDIKVRLSDDGLIATVVYTWPDTMYNVRDLFKRQLKNPAFQIYHPMVVAFNAGLEKSRKRVGTAPLSSVKVYLPIKVQTDETSWKRWGEKRDNGAHVLLVEFTGHVTEYVKRSADQSVVFENIE